MLMGVYQEHVLKEVSRGFGTETAELRACFRYERA